MSIVEIRRVADKKGLKAFIDFHYDLYDGNRYDAPNLYSDEVHTLSKDKNASFEFCEAEYFLAYKDGCLVGRVVLSTSVLISAGNVKACASDGLTLLTTRKSAVPYLEQSRSGGERKE